MMRQFFSSILLTALVSIALEAQTTRKVPRDFPTIQAAINAAQNGNIVRVAPGIYVENINFLGKSITVLSEAGADVTTIDGGLVGPVVRFSTGETSSAVLDGFTIRNGRALTTDGGGILISATSPTIRHNHIIGNVACHGLGIAIVTGSPLIQGNVISDNVNQNCTGGGGGGGILISRAGSAQILDNTISNNSAILTQSGGGIYLFSAGTPIIRGNIITGNSAIQGGGIALDGSSDATIIQNIIAGNTAQNGGGISWSAATGFTHAAITNNTIVDNGATQKGSAIYEIGFSGTIPVKNNLIIGKTSQTAIHCETVSSVNPPVFAFNDIFSDQASSFSGVCSDPSGTNGNISISPLFVDRASRNFQLMTGSAGIDGGDNTISNLPIRDLASFPRILPSGGSVDMGAYEFVASTTYSVSTSSVDFGSQSAGTSSAPADVILTNTGASVLFVTSVSATGEFSQTNTCQNLAGIPAGQTCIVSVRFAPGAGGARTGQLVVISNSASGNTVSLSGIGSGSLTFVTTPIDFSDQRVGTTSVVTTLGVSNSGITPLDISSIRVTGDFTGFNDCPVPLPAGSSCTISLRFAPTTRGILYGAVAVDALGSLQLVTLSGRGLAPTITLSPSSLLFGNQALGIASVPKTVTVGNQGDLALAIIGISMSGDFSGTNDCGNSLAVNSICTISVFFTPTALGTRNGAITVTDDAVGGAHSVALSGTSNGGVMTPSLTSIDFGNQAVNITSPTKFLTLRNTGNSTVTVSSVVTSSEFSKTGTCATLVPNSICALQLTFTPTTVGPRTGTLTVTSSAFGSPLVLPLSGTGVDVVFSPSPLSFGDIHIGTTATRTTTFTNTSPNPVSVSGISVTGGFAQVNNCGPSLASGASCSFDVTFSPVTAGLVVSGTLTVMDDAVGNPHTVPLSGRGVVGTIVFSPATLTFDPDLVGTSSPSRTLTVMNSGNGLLTFLGISTSGDFTQTTNCAQTLATGANCSVNVKFSPTAIGSRTGSLTVSSDGAGSPNSASLTGTGLNSLPTPVVTGISPDNISVGSPGLTLTVNGSGFSSLSVVRWGGSDRPTTYVNNATLTAAISTNDFATMAAHAVTVFNPSPGGGLSNTFGFVVYGAATLTTKDLAGDRVGNRIYASVPGTAPIRANTLTPIDPVTGTLGSSTAIGSEPGKLVISGDSRTIYVALDGAGQVRPFDTTSQNPGVAFALGSDPTFGTYYAEDIAVAPDNSGTIAVSRKNLSISPRHAGVAIYDNGVKRAVETPRHTGSNLIEFSTSASTLYGYNNESSENGFRTMNVDASGVAIANVQGNLISGSVIDMQFEGGRIYATSGQVIDPVSRTQIGVFPLPIDGTVKGLVADSALGQAFILYPNAATTRILAYDLGTFTLTGSMTLPIQGSSTNMGSLIRWGETGLAFRTTSQVFTFQVPQHWLKVPSASYVLAPDSAQQGQANLNIAITGQFTNFSQGQTTANFGAGITVNSLAVADALHATANITIAPAATVGPRRVTVSIGSLVLTMPDVFTVTAAPGLLTTWGLGSSLSASPAGIFKAIATGESHSIALRADGTLVGWGNNDFGQINVPAGTFTAIAVGAADSFAIRTDGTLVGWGYSPNGETSIPPGTYKAVAGGASHTIAIRTDGTLVGWGNNTFGQINVPAGTFTAIAAAGVFNIAIRTDGTLVGWGSNFNGLIDVPAGTFTAIVVGSQHSVALRTDGTLAAWGSNNYGQTNVPAGTFAAISAGERNSFALRSDGTLISWGDTIIGSVPAGKYTAIAARTNRLVALGNHPNAPRDFNGDGRSDVLWRDTSGRVSLWQMNGYTVTGDSVIATIWTGWTFVGSGDFNADGKMDILWRDGTGNVVVWLMDGATVSSFTTTGNMPVSWSIAGVADFNGDGMADILWRNVSGDVAIWQMNGAGISSSTVIANIWIGWTIAGTGDFNADGRADILWREDSGTVGIWLMNGTSVISSTVVANIWPGWSIVGTGDFNADGIADILWREKSGDVGIWLMNGTSVISSKVVANIWIGWTIAAIGDFNGDGKADLLWRDGSGNTSIWLMDGTSVADWAGRGNVADRVAQ